MQHKTTETIEDVAALLGSYAYDPVGFVYAAFPWGEGELAGKTGPDKWQEDLLREVGDGVKDINTVTREAVASGHGIGKSCLVAWLILWALTTHEDTRGVVTANTETQLRSKTWPELAKWYRLFIGKPLFKYTATAIFSTQKEHDKTWRVDAIPWSKENTEAFAGLHNQGKRILVVFDEASAIWDGIWEVTEGALTDSETEIIWCAFGNPTRNTGAFHDCFENYQRIWNCRQIDSRTVAISNKQTIATWLEQYGEDSDFFKIRVRGVFPSASSNQLITLDLVNSSMARRYHPDEYRHAPKIMGVDVARFGDDRSTIFYRQGLGTLPPKVYRKLDTMMFADIVAEEIRRWRPDAVFIDNGAMGPGVIDRLRQLGFTNIIEVNFGSAPISDRYFNRRTEMYFKARDWLRAGGALPDDKDLKAELTMSEYTFTDNGKPKMVKKEIIKKEMGVSPDLADGFVLTFAQEVVPRDDVILGKGRGFKANTDYDFGFNSRPQKANVEYRFGC